MATTKWILPAATILVLIYFLGQNYRSLCVIDQQEELLRHHLSRLRSENEHNGLLVTNAAQSITTRSYLIEKYLDTENHLKPEFAYIPSDTSDLLISLEQEHHSKYRLNEGLSDFFSHTDMVLTHIRVLKKSITDDRVHVGIYRNLHIEGKYQVEINKEHLPFSDEGLYMVECADTFNLEIKMYTINYKTSGVDTTIFKEQLIVSNL